MIDLHETTIIDCRRESSVPYGTVTRSARSCLLSPDMWQIPSNPGAGEYFDIAPLALC